MIKEGCLEGVDEIYGFHNIPIFDEGEVRVIPGPIMAQGVTVKIRVLGKGGHGSVPHLINDVITAGAAILNALHTVKSRCLDSRDNFTFTITHFTSGFTYNVFPDEAFMQGTMRSFNKAATETACAKVKQIAENTALAMGCRAEVECNEMYPPVINHPKETEHVIRVPSATFGAEKVKSEMLPIPGGEDFAFYLENKPGCFYILGTRIPDKAYMVHTNCYDYNDSMIASGGLLFVRIVEDRLGVNIF
jgi:hippurate hydrolase